VNDPSEPSEPGNARSRLSIVTALSVVIGLCAVLAWCLKPARPASDANPAGGPPVAKPPSLRVSSDVAGALVFVDSKFLGKTPLETHEVLAGSHRLRVAAEGYDEVSRSIEVAGAGPTDVSVSLNRVVLDARVPVVHKHRLGSCEGSLIANLHELRYETSEADDVMRLSFSNLERFAVDDDGRTLQVKERGGRTWNFTTRTANADPLLRFQREVDRARSRLAQKPE
jgi:hypothetical protein